MFAMYFEDIRETLSVSLQMEIITVPSLALASIVNSPRTSKIPDATNPRLRALASLIAARHSCRSICGIAVLNASSMPRQNITT